MSGSVIDTGGGPRTIVFSHGSFMDKTMFAPQVSFLSGLGWRCISYDSRALTRPRDMHDLADLAADCLSLADARGVGSFVLCGMSVGAFMAVELALAQPGRLEAMILIDGKAAAYSEAERRALAPLFAPLDVDGTIPADFAEWLATMCFGATTRKTRSELAAGWVRRWTGEIPARSAHRQYRSWIDKADRRADLPRIHVPTLIIHGEEDVPTPLSHSTEMAERMPDAALLVVPRAGHTSNLEQPDFVNAAIKDFLGRATMPDRSRNGSHARTM
jgi:pimeloyl-ACP methyl ester carboxylesterase